MKLYIKVIPEMIQTLHSTIHYSKMLKRESSIYHFLQREYRNFLDDLTTVYTILNRKSYLHQCKVNYKWNSATKYGISTVFCTMSHAVVPCIASNNQILMIL